MPLPALIQASKRLTHWMINNALPLWAKDGFNTENGSAYEQLNANGTPDTLCPKRVRVQYRQSFVFSVAAERGWLPEAGVRVGQIQHWLDTHARHPKVLDLYVHRLTAQDQHLDDRLDTYDQAFFLLACAWRFRAFGDKQALHRAEALQRYLDNHIKGHYGGWLEGDYDTPVRRQNPHMHLFEAYMALYQATRHSGWLARAGSIFTLFETRFFTPETGMVLEYFHPDWQPLSAAQGQTIEPGHMMEWVWLLDQYGQLSGTPVAHYCETLFGQALRLGQDAASGLLFDEIAPDGKVTKPSKRLWPMTELIKAALTRARQGHTDAEGIAARAIDGLFTYYFSSAKPGAYCDQLDQHNRVMNAKAPASSLYHLMVAVMELQDFCNRPAPASNT